MRNLTKRLNERPRVLPQRVALVIAFIVTLLLSGCAVTFVSSYDPESVNRTTEVSKSVLALYQELIAIEPAERKAAVTGPLRTKHGDIETQIRVHLLREQGRTPNTEGETVASAGILADVLRQPFFRRREWR